MDKELKQCLISSLYYTGYKRKSIFIFYNNKQYIHNNVMYVGETLKDSLIRYGMTEQDMLNAKVTNEYGVTLQAFGHINNILMVYDHRLDPDDENFYFKEKTTIR